MIFYDKAGWGGVEDGGDLIVQIYCDTGPRFLSKFCHLLRHIRGTDGLVLDSMSSVFPPFNDDGSRGTELDIFLSCFR